MWKLFGAAVIASICVLAGPNDEAAAGDACIETSEGREAQACYSTTSCETNQAACGAVVYANAGGYVVNPVEIYERDNQPSDKATISSLCNGIKFNHKKDVQIGRYIMFVVPGECAYKLKIQIALGKSKDRDLFLTPGCAIEAKTDGTTLNNEWHVKASWTDAAKQKGASGTVQDADGNKCGNEGKM
jgi:hypothetical protein